MQESEGNGENKMRIVAFVNSGSGAQKGGKFMKFIERFLGKGFVFDLKEDKGAEKGLRLHDDARGEDEEMRVLACGGDGTFSWVAGSISSLGLKRIALLPVPLGSGNDMSRALGWGFKYPGTAKFAKILEYVERSETSNLDVWSYQIASTPAASGDEVVEAAPGYFCNYLSIGVDAQVELHFNEARWEHPDKFNSRMGNIMWHAAYGAKLSMRDKKVRRIREFCEKLVVDGEEVPLPENVQALLILNIPSYAAGASPWGRPKDASEWTHSMVDDCALEVMALTNLNHFVRMKAVGQHALRLGQGAAVELTLKSGVDSIPVQADGEPWRQDCGQVFSVKLARQMPTVAGPYYKEKMKNHATFTEPVEIIDRSRSKKLAAV